MQSENKSEVARLKQEIEDGYHAAQLAMYGFSQVGQHEVITKHMECMWGSAEKLQRIAGKEAVNRVMVGLQ